MANKTEEVKTERKLSPEEIAIKTDPEVEIIFNNLEFADADVKFTYGGKTFHLTPGKKYKLPVCVIEHLNGLKYPNRRYDPSAPSGQQIIVDGVSHRFNCQIVDMRGFVNAKQKGNE